MSFSSPETSQGTGGHFPRCTTILSCTSSLRSDSVMFTVHIKTFHYTCGPFVRSVLLRSRLDPCSDTLSCSQ